MHPPPVRRAMACSICSCAVVAVGEVCWNGSERPSQAQHCWWREAGPGDHRFLCPLCAPSMDEGQIVWKMCVPIDQHSDGMLVGGRQSFGEGPECVRQGQGDCMERYSEQIAVGGSNRWIPHHCRIAGDSAVEELLGLDLRKKGWHQRRVTTLRDQLHMPQLGTSRHLDEGCPGGSDSASSRLSYPVAIFKAE